MLATLGAQVDPKHTAVIVVDVQNDFCARGGALDARGNDVSEVQVMVPVLASFIEEARRAGARIIWVRMLNTDWTTSPSWRFRLHRADRQQMAPICAPDGWGQEYYQIRPATGEIEVFKHRYSAFVGTNLDLILRSMEIRTLIMTGVATNVCVESTARDGYMMDYYVVFIKDCTAAFTSEGHEATLKNIADYFGIVASSAEVIEAWKTLNYSQRC
ncbi:MAG: cysteine hydrolase [Chloroflexi bacterium]|nr:cysteine hydrolase [Chloroflexota bacterium]MDA8188788.1 cysteine hydrolase [Dehalococcoidales bacterium]